MISQACGKKSSSENTGSIQNPIGFTALQNDGFWNAQDSIGAYDITSFIKGRKASTIVLFGEKGVVFHDEITGHYAKVDASYFPGTAYQQVGDYVYVIGNDRALYKIDIGTKIITPITIDEVFELKGFQVGGNGTLTIQGTLSDGSSFIGTWDTQNALNVISRIGADQTIVVTPLE
jgi:hypothetical protein